MGVLPLEFKNGMTRKDLNLTGEETFDITGVEAGMKPHMEIIMTITRADDSTQKVPLLCRIDTLDEVDYFKNGGILPYVLRSLTDKKAAAA
jgi:aconitate hydratase